MEGFKAAKFGKQNVEIDDMNFKMQITSDKTYHSKAKTEVSVFPCCIYEVEYINNKVNKVV